MCTVTWIRESGGYQLFSNRDEKLTRQPSTAVQAHSRDGVRFLAPLDGDCGGTWLAANEFGVSLCLLNGPGVQQGRRSRGRLIIDWITSRSVKQSAARFLHAGLDQVAPFRIAALEPHMPTLLLDWDGRRRGISERSARYDVLASSSLDYDAAVAGRREQFAWLAATHKNLQTGHLLAFHRSHGPERGPYSPCMHRRDAETVSFSWLTVTSSHVELYHSAGSPCCSLAGHSQTLVLHQEELAA